MKSSRIDVWRNADTKARVAELLGLSDPDGFLHEAAVRHEWVAECLAPDERDDNTAEIHGYELLERIGSGGMSVVWLARRTGLAERYVALKIIDAAFFAPDRRKYFDQERRVLATLEHPYIARLYDAGVVSDGRGYLVMEYVAGTHIDRYCSDRGLAIDSILQLLRKISDALAYAHRKLIVHGDLKPSNILVDANSDPRLIDFGISEFAAHAEDVSDGPRHLTPAYCSPEQRNGRALTTSTDVYSLGVVGSKLLNGHLQRLPEDVRAILSKCMSEDPEQRYATAQELREDIDRYLSSRPVRAREQTVTYRGTKFIRRNAVLCAAATLTLLAVVAGTATAIYQKQRAERSLQHARSLLGTLVGEGYSRVAQQPNSVKENAALYDLRVAYLENLRRDSEQDTALARELLVNLFYRGTMEGYPDNMNLGDTAKSLRTFDEALRLARQLAARPDAAVQDRINLAMALNYLGALQAEHEEYAAALASHSEAEQLMRIEPAVDGAEVAANLALSLQRAGDALVQSGHVGEGIAKLREALHIRRTLRSSPSQWPTKEMRQVSIVLKSLGFALLSSADWRGAVDAFSEGARLEQDMLDRQPDKSLRHYAVTETKWFLSMHLLGEASALLLAADPKSAMTRQAAAESLARELLNVNDGNARAFRTLAAALDLSSGIDLAVGNKSAAVASLTESLQILQQVAALPGAGRRVGRLRDDAASRLRNLN